MNRGIGIYVGKKHVVAAALRRSGNNVQLDKWAAEPFAAASAETDKITPEAAAIRIVLEKIGAKNSFARVALGPFQVVTRYFIMPMLPQREKDEAIRYEASRYTRLKITESIFAYTENAKVQNVFSVTSNAAKKRAIQSLVMHLRRGSAQPEAIEPGYLPYSRAASHWGAADFGKANLLVWFDSDQSVNVTLNSKNMVFLAQDFKLSGDLKEDQEKMHDELQGSFRYLNEHAGGVAVERILLAGFGDLESWADYLTKTFPSIEPAVLRVPLNESDDQTFSGALVMPFGLALGEMNVKSVLGELSLLPVEEKKMRPERFLASLALAAAAVFAVFFLISFFVLAPMHHSLEAKKRREEAPLAAFGTISTEKVDKLDIKAMLADAKFSKLDAFQKGNIPMYEVLASLVSVLPKSIWLQSIDLKSSRGRRLYGDAPSAVEDKKNLSPRLIFEGYCYLGDSEKETKQVNEWVQNLAKQANFSRRFGHLAVDEIKQQKIAGRSTTHFKVSAEV